MATRYDERFFARIRGGCQRSAAVVAPIVYDAVRPETVVDVGCGEGWWGAAFQSLGVSVIGLDGSPPREPPIKIIPMDLSIPINPPPEGRADLAVCLEVAEHLPESRAESLVADLCALAPVVLFSAAQPHQGGVGHVNCQPPGYWVSLFGDHGYDCSGALRWLVWNEPDVEPWYKSNLLLCVKDGFGFLEGAAMFDAAMAHPFHVTHPDLWLTR